MDGCGFEKIRVLLDGHNLGLKQPTGIGTYVLNLSECLQSLGFDLSVLYSMNTDRYGSTKDASFFQKIVNEGESGSTGIFRWGYHAAPYVFNFLFRKGIGINSINPADKFILDGFTRKIPSGASIGNLPHIFRVSQALAALTAKGTPITPSENFHFDILHLTMPLPLAKGRFKKIVTLHDLIPLKLPQSTNVNLKHYLNIINASTDDADLIFAVSEQTKRDAIDLLGIKENKIHVTYQSSNLPDELRNLSREEILPLLESYGLETDKYFIYYGAIEPKKNVLRVLNAFVKSNTDCKLVIVGKNGWLFDDVEMFFENQKYRNRIIRLPYADFVDLMYLLKGARALLFPSLYEGFGLPALEAMQIGTPVITSNSGSLPEVCGNVAHYVDPYSINDIKNAIELYSDSGDQLDSMKQLGFVQSLKFSKAEYQKRVAAGYSLLL